MRFKDLQKAKILFFLQAAVPAQRRISPAIGPCFEITKDDMDRQLEEPSITR